MSITYIPKNVKLTFSVATSYEIGDYARLFWNHGSDVIDWATPADYKKHSLFQDDSGYFGWGHQTWGHFDWGHAQTRNVPGWAHLPWAYFPWGHGAAIINIIKTIVTPGYYAFGAESYDEAGNAHGAGDPGSDALCVSLTPKKPDALHRYHYDGLDILTLTAEERFVGAR